jgi:integrase
MQMINAKGKKSPDALFEITVPGAISKVRRTRQFMVGDNGYVLHLLHMAAKRVGFKDTPSAYTQKTEAFLFKNLGALLKIIADDLLFSIDGETPVTARAIYVHFENLLERAEIADASERGIVPYSFRHSFITHKVNSGLDLVSVAEMCGTSVAQIEKTYYRTTREKMKANALLDYDVVNGAIVRSQ